MALLSIWSTPGHWIACSSLSLALNLTTLLLAPAILRAQRVSGVLGVSATLLPPIMTQGAELASVRMERNGIAHLETTPPIAGAVSLIVMTTVASSANGFVPVTLPPALVRASGRRHALGAAASPADSTAPRWRYQLPLGTPPGRADSSDVSVRISYLVVPGT